MKMGEHGLGRFGGYEGSVTWVEAVEMIVRGIDVSQLIKLDKGDRIALLQDAKNTRIALVVTPKDGPKWIAAMCYQAKDNMDRVELLFKSLVRRQAHQGSEEVRAWAIQVILDMDAEGRCPWTAEDSE